MATEKEKLGDLVRSNQALRGHFTQKQAELDNRIADFTSYPNDVSLKRVIEVLEMLRRKHDAVMDSCDEVILQSMKMKEDETTRNANQKQSEIEGRMSTSERNVTKCIKEWEEIQSKMKRRRNSWT